MFKPKTSSLSNERTDTESSNSPRADLTVNVLPEVATEPFFESDSKTGVSTRNALPQTKVWYILRTVYGQERKAYDYIIEHGGTAFYPTITTCKTIKGTKQVIKSSRIPNLFFAYGTFDEIKSFVYDNVHLPFLRFYYEHIHEGAKIVKRPLTIPNSQLESLRIICNLEEHDIIVYDQEITKFQVGAKVRVIDGDFKGVEGIVARFHGQQRVGIVVEGIMTVITAYIPNAFIEHIDKHR